MFSATPLDQRSSEVGIPPSSSGSAATPSLNVSDKAIANTAEAVVGREAGTPRARYCRTRSTLLPSPPRPRELKWLAGPRASQAPSSAHASSAHASSAHASRPPSSAHASSARALRPPSSAHASSARASRPPSSAHASSARALRLRSFSARFFNARFATARFATARFTFRLATAFLIAFRGISPSF